MIFYVIFKISVALGCLMAMSSGQEIGGFFNKGFGENFDNFGNGGDSFNQDGTDHFGANDGNSRFGFDSFDDSSFGFGFESVPQEVKVLPGSVSKRSAEYKRFPRDLVLEQKSEDSNDHHGGRFKRGYGYVGPVFTSVKTDYHGNFQWKTKHAVGKKFGGGYH